MSAHITPADWADALAQRAGTYGLIQWLPELAQWLNDVSFASWLSIDESNARITVTSRAKGVAFTLTSSERERIKALERENRELRRANDILRTASAFFAQAEQGRKLKS